MIYLLEVDRLRVRCMVGALGEVTLSDAGNMVSCLARDALGI
mgnify:CR=1 FL=1